MSELKRTGIMPKDLDTSCGTGNSEHLVISEKLGVSVEFIWFRGQYGWIEIIAAMTGMNYTRSQVFPVDQ